MPQQRPTSEQENTVGKVRRACRSVAGGGRGRWPAGSAGGAGSAVPGTPPRRSGRTPALRFAAPAPGSLARRQGQFQVEGIRSKAFSFRRLKLFGVIPLPAGTRGRWGPWGRWDDGVGVRRLAGCAGFPPPDPLMQPGHCAPLVQALGSGRGINGLGDQRRPWRLQKPNSAQKGPPLAPRARGQATVGPLRAPPGRCALAAPRGSGPQPGRLGHGPGGLALERPSRHAAPSVPPSGFWATSLL